MQRIFPTTCAVAAMVVWIAAAASAQELKSGLAAGRTMISMPMEKVGGASDGVDVGETICYT